MLLNLTIVQTREDFIKLLESKNGHHLVATEQLLDVYKNLPNDNPFRVPVHTELLKHVGWLVEEVQELGSASRTNGNLLDDLLNDIQGTVFDHIEEASGSIDNIINICEKELISKCMTGDSIELHEISELSREIRSFKGAQQTVTELNILFDNMDNQLINKYRLILSEKADEINIVLERATEIYHELERSYGLIQKRYDDLSNKLKGIDTDLASDLEVGQDMMETYRSKIYDL